MYILHLCYLILINRIKMPTKAKPTSRTKSGSKPKSKISNKLIAAIIVGVVAIAGIAIIFNSFASTQPAYTYSFYTSCLSDKKSTTVKSDIGNYNVTVPWDTKSNCLKDSAEEQAYRLNRAVTNGKPPNPPTDYNKYKELVQKMAGDRVPVPELVPQSFLDQFKDKSDAEFVTQVFKNVLYRTPGDNGAAWAADMRKNGWSRKDAVFIISSSPEAKDKNVALFSEFLRNNPNPININPVAQNAQNVRDEEAKTLVEVGMKAANFRILQLRGEINSAGTYAKAKPKQDEVSRIMIDLGKGMERFSALYTQSLTANTTQAIAIAKMNDYKRQADAYLNSSWAATVEAGQRAEKYRVDEENARIAAQNRSRQKQEQKPKIASVEPGPGDKGGWCGSSFTDQDCDNLAAWSNRPIQPATPTYFKPKEIKGTECKTSLVKTYERQKRTKRGFGFFTWYTFHPQKIGVFQKICRHWKQPGAPSTAPRQYTSTWFSGSPTWENALSL